MSPKSGIFFLYKEVTNQKYGNSFLLVYFLGPSIISESVIYVTGAAPHIP